MVFEEEYREQSTDATEAYDRVQADSAGASVLPQAGVSA